MQGLKENRKQFYLLVVINAFVGSMIGLERSILPGLASEFKMDSHLAVLSFIVAFGLSKSVFNLLSGKFTDYFSRKNILILGWVAALPVPFLLMYAQNWNWILLANVFLGINQGLAWSSTVIMKIDLVGEKNRGLAMGINEFAGYVSVGIAAYLASVIAADSGFRFYPFVPGIFISITGLLLSVLFVKDTAKFVAHEALHVKMIPFKSIWRETSFNHKNVGTVTINGFVNNMNDGVVWGLLPVLLLTRGFDLSHMGFVAASYPVFWGIGQVFTGKLGDRYCKKQIIAAGMILQALGLVLLAFSFDMIPALLAMMLLGSGTALVYPNFLSVVAENTNPDQRAKALGIFRFWRDGGYVAGAVLSGLLADYFGVSSAIIIIGIVTALAGVMALVRMCCTYKLLWRGNLCAEAY